MIAVLVADAERMNRRDKILSAQRKLVRRVVANRVAALLCLQQQSKSRIAADVDARDGVHLDGDIQFHLRVRFESMNQVLASNAANRWRGSRRGAISMTSKRRSKSACSGCVISQACAASMMRR